MAVHPVTAGTTTASSTDGSQPWPTPVEGYCELKDFHFLSDESLPKLRIHYHTLGEPRYDANGRTTNAVLIMHGTGGTGEQFLRDIFAGQLFNPGQPLDATKYFIILRDGIGHGKSSKPSDKLRAKFPKYGYRDMIAADHALLTQGLGVNHLRLVMGTSMGGMQSWLWAGTYPDFVDAAMPLASLPTEIAGRNRMTRKAIIDAITEDPTYNRGDYETQPVHGLKAALYTLMWMKSIPLQWQKECPDRESAEAFLHSNIRMALRDADANDMLYYVSASADYDPWPLLGEIKAPLLAINSADDQVNPPSWVSSRKASRELPRAVPLSFRLVARPVATARTPTRLFGVTNW
ncbi:homoserine O-acetyltransferase [Penicillium lagena]|uniref:homoserine O-acetyltransferase n=1 Tax=Penicillium lagena TaxID=94218 RepID=UPI0025420024|nr:homoserine O-acetyltransferase [Penicillium lagena]KAJ5611389.1 homoserine O-acetyltransferase [Penicillium lagena]